MYFLAAHRRFDSRNCSLGFFGVFFSHPLPVLFFLLIVPMACFNPEYSDPMKGWILQCLSDEGGIHRCRLVGTEV